MSKSWKQDKRWSDKFLPEIKSILGQVLISEPPVEEDQERNTDLMVLRLDAVRIACRVRTNKYLTMQDGRYRYEFTIRAGRPSGIKTELAKVIEGWGDYIFYGFSDVDDKNLAQWFIGDLKVFRSWYARYLFQNQGELPGFQKPNYDGSSFFFAYSLYDLPNNFIVSSSWFNHESVMAA